MKNLKFLKSLTGGWQSWPRAIYSMARGAGAAVEMREKSILKNWGLAPGHIFLRDEGRYVMTSDRVTKDERQGFDDEGRGGKEEGRGKLGAARTSVLRVVKCSRRLGPTLGAYDVKACLPRHFGDLPLENDEKCALPAQAWRHF